MKKLIAAAGLGAAVAVSSLLGAGTANAYDNETYFLQLQVSHGWTIWNPAGHVAKAYQVCNQLDQGTNGYAVRDNVYYSNGPWSLSEATSFVQDSATALCPWTWDSSPTPLQRLT